MDVSEIRYAPVDGSRIAYQEFGAGERVVYIPPIVSHIEMKWEHEFHRRVLDHLGAHLHILHFDKRGVGLSDSYDGQPTAEDRVKDIAAVMDAAGWDRAHILGISEGADMAMLFAAHSPQRVERVVLMGAAAPSSYGERVEQLSAGHHRTVDEITAEIMEVAGGWGEDALPFARLFAPSRVDDTAYLRWANRLNRLSASPAQFAAQLFSIPEIREAIDPEGFEGHAVLVVHVEGDRVNPVGNGRLLAETIPEAEYVEVPGTDHLVYSLDNWRDAIDPAIEFITGRRPAASPNRRFGVVLFTDIVNSTATAAGLGDARYAELIDRHDSACHRTVFLNRGRVVKSTGDGVLAVFDSPSDAVHCTRDLRTALAELGIAIRAGLHAGEIEEHADGDVSGLAVNVAARVEQAADDGAIFVSETMQQLLLGTEFEFREAGEHQLKGIDGSWTLCELR